MKIADLQVLNASQIDALWACRSAVFTSLCPRQKSNLSLSCVMTEDKKFGNLGSIWMWISPLRSRIATLLIMRALSATTPHPTPQVRLYKKLEEKTLIRNLNKDFKLCFHLNASTLVWINTLNSFTAFYRGGSLFFLQVMNIQFHSLWFWCEEVPSSTSTQWNISNR